MFSSNPTQDSDEEDEPIGGGFYSNAFNSVNQSSFDMGASYHTPSIDQFIDTDALTSNHVLSPPSESYVQLAQDQFNQGEILKFKNGTSAKQHYSLAALYFKKAAEDIHDVTTKKALIYMADNAETMASMFLKTVSKSDAAADFRSPLSSPKSSLFESPASPSAATVSESLSDSAYNLESVLNAPHHYDRIYTVLPMSTSMSFFGGFNPAPAPSDEFSRASLKHSRARASGVSMVPSMDLSTSSSFSGAPTSSSSLAPLSKPMQQFLRDLRLLERRLGAIGLMPISSAAAAQRDDDNAASKSALSSSTARLNFLSSRLDESFIVLPQNIPRTGAGIKFGEIQSSGTKIAKTQTSINTDSDSQPNPYGRSNSSSTNSKSTGQGPVSSRDKRGGKVGNDSTAAATGYWGAGIGLLQMASKITGIASAAGQDSGEKKVKSSAPYGGAAAMSQKPSRGGADKHDVDDRMIDRTFGDLNTDQGMHWNEFSTVLQPPPLPTTHRGQSSISAGDKDKDRTRGGRARTESWESVSSSGELESELLAVASQRTAAGKGGVEGVGGSGGTEGVLRLLSTIERLSEENSRLEKAVETLKSAQNKNAHLTSQIDQFKVEYKLRIDQMRADMILQMSAQSGTKNTDKEKGEDDLKDKKLNELERTIHALLRKMAEMKQESDKKDAAIKHYKAKREKRQKEKLGQGDAASLSTRTSLSTPSTSTSTSTTEVVAQSSRYVAPVPAPVSVIPPSENSSLASRRGIAARTVSTTAATATATAIIPVDTGSSMAGNGYGGARCHSQSRNRISLVSASPSTATTTATLRTSLQKELSAGIRPTSRQSPPPPR